MASPEVLQRLESRASTAEQLISVLKMQIAQIKTTKASGSYDDQVINLKLNNGLVNYFKSLASIYY